jgi:general secretion pathway protein I
VRALGQWRQRAVGGRLVQIIRPTELWVLVDFSIEYNASARWTVSTLRQRPSEHAFSLLEAMVAVAIAGLALGVLFKAVGGGVRAAQTAGRYEQALSLARSHLAAAATFGLAKHEEAGEDGNGFRWSLEVTPLYTMLLPRSPGRDSAGFFQQATLYGLTIIESWGSNDRERHVRLDSARVASGPPAGG